MTPEEFFTRLADMQTWKRGQERAPHKPLLLLLALGHLQQGKTRLRLYRCIESELRALLVCFGPPRRLQHPEYSLQRLQNDGLWELQGLLSSHLNASGQLRPSRVRHSEVRGGLPKEVHDLLKAHPSAFRLAVQYLLHAHFPEGIHPDLLAAVHLDGSLLSPGERADHALLKIRPRDPRFRSAVVVAYDYRCAVCGYDIQLQDQLLGLDAAHIFWHSNGGPDEVPNGLALCAIHHRAFDRGGIGLGNQRELLVSPGLQGQPDVLRFWFQRFAGQSIRSPQRSRHEPDPAYLQWHRDQVFRGCP